MFLLAHVQQMLLVVKTVGLREIIPLLSVFSTQEALAVSVKWCRIGKFIYDDYCPSVLCTKRYRYTLMSDWLMLATYNSVTANVAEIGKYTLTK